MASEPRKPKKEVRVRQVPAVSRSIAILRLLGNTRQGMGVKAIADAQSGLEMPEGAGRAVGQKK